MADTDTEWTDWLAQPLRSRRVDALTDALAAAEQAKSKAIAEQAYAMAEVLACDRQLVRLIFSQAGGI